MLKEVDEYGNAYEGLPEIQIFEVQDNPDEAMMMSKENFAGR